MNKKGKSEISASKLLMSEKNTEDVVWMVHYDYKKVKKDRLH